MPKLPASQTSTDNQLLEKDTWSRGSIAPKPPANTKIPGRKFHILHFRLVAILCVAVIVLVLIYVGAVKFLPEIKSKFGNVNQPAPRVQDYPVKADDIVFPSNEIREKFLANYQKASEEQDVDERYKLLLENYSLLKSFYASNPDYNFRLRLEQYAEYMKNNFPKQFENNADLYQQLCLDTQCGEVKYAAEIEEIKNGIVASKAVSDQGKDAIIKNFDGAALNSGDGQVNFYLGAYSVLFFEYSQTNDAGLKVQTTKLYEFIIAKFPSASIPESLKP